MQSLLAKVDALRTEVKRRKEEIYAQRSRDANAPDMLASRDAATELRNLQSQLDDLWNGVYTGTLDARAATAQFEFLAHAYGKL